MNILIPDSWLREHLKTKASVSQIKEYLSLCGPSIERVMDVNGEPVYDIEVTTNRVDMMSIRGIAHEACAILPQFGLNADILPLKITDFSRISSNTGKLDIRIINDPKLCSRIIAIKLENVKLDKSPDWICRNLEAAGQRPLNNIIDITNYVMWEIGHPIHAFDYDRLKTKKIIVREGKKGETLITLDYKKHRLSGGEIVFDDGKGNIIDLPGIMGTANTVVNESTKNVLLLIENSDPVRIRQASMGLSIRTQAAVLNEKHPSPKLAQSTLARAVYLAKSITGASIGSRLYDDFSIKPKIPNVLVRQSQINLYLNQEIKPESVSKILKSLGFRVNIKSGKPDVIYDIGVPDWRIDDIKISQDLIEEIARIFGYHNINPVLPSGEIKPAVSDPILRWEEKIKIRMRDWGFSEIYPYSMISEKLVKIFGYNPHKLYRITNPLNSELVYMRPGLLPTAVSVLGNNISIKPNLRLFELSHAYLAQPGNLPDEHPFLVALGDGDIFRELKGISEIIFELMGIPYPVISEKPKSQIFDENKSLSLHPYGTLGILKPELLDKLRIPSNVTALELDFGAMVKNANSEITYEKIPKYPSLIEDLAFNVPDNFLTGSYIQQVKNTSPLIHNVFLIDTYKNIRTFRIEYLSRDGNLSTDDVRPLRENIISFSSEKFGLSFRNLPK